jgi:hypothetical protein
MTVLKGIGEIEMLCLNSRENFEDNKRFLRNRMEKEDNPVICKLLQADLTFLDRIQIQMATAREFLIIIRMRDKKDILFYTTPDQRGGIQRRQRAQMAGWGFAERSGVL